MSLPCRVHCIRQDLVTRLTAGVSPARRRGGGHRPQCRARQAPPALAVAAWGSCRRTCCESPFPGQRRPHCLHSDKKCGLMCFLFLRKCRVQGQCLQDRKSQAQRKASLGPPFSPTPTENPGPLPGTPTCSPALAWGRQAGDHSWPVPRQSGAFRPTRTTASHPPSQAGWAKAVRALPQFLGCPEAPKYMGSPALPGRRPSSLQPCPCGWPAVPLPPGSSAV